jgi:hypothetical protein
MTFQKIFYDKNHFTPNQTENKINDPHLLSFQSIFSTKVAGSAVVLTDRRESSHSRWSEIQDQP